ncbi:uncharacterized protein LOC111387459 isoform X3 [Olea europaea var. sylvestris]|uniref:uncharacterized protein LOC111387459 isoform X3 n=1 Tax=Olea europaea var. sylvestris TaxID=158386 RepID=UPI000C1D197F|nr:uncharacterized protein LOC111387459 isoform X3 [Olea europaea var. sylvestris]
MNMTTWFVQKLYMQTNLLCRPQAIENNGNQDISAAQVRGGRDIQGIPWGRLGITRERYRKNRLEQYKNYENIPRSGEGLEKECKITKRGNSYYEFRRNSMSVKSTILHFQVCNNF